MALGNFAGANGAEAKPWVGKSVTNGNGDVALGGAAVTGTGAAGDDYNTAVGFSTQALGGGAVAIGGDEASGAGGAAFADGAGAVAIERHRPGDRRFSTRRFGFGNSVAGTRSGAFGRQHGRGDSAARSITDDTVTVTTGYSFSDPNTINGNRTSSFGNDNSIDATNHTN